MTKSMFRRGCIAAILALALPGAALADTATGYIGFGYAAIDDDDDSAKTSFTTFEGAVVTPLSGEWNVQFDARSNDMNHDSHNDGFSAFNAHAFSRNDAWALGAFAGQNNRVGSSFWNVGVEGQYYAKELTFSAAYAFAQETNDWSSEDVNTLELNVAYFLTPDTALGGDLTWYNDEWESEDGYLFGVSLEHQLSGSPVSLGAHVHVTDSDYSGGGGHQTDLVGVFARWNFGTPDLQTRSREGASMPGGASIGRENIGTW